MKLQTKFSLLISLLVVIIVLGVTGTLLITESRFLVREMEDGRVAMIKSLAQVAAESLIGRDEILLLNYLKLLRRTPGLAFASVQDAAGTVLAHTDMSLLGTRPAGAAVEKARAADGLLAQKYAPDGGEPLLELSLPVVAAGGRAGVARIGFSQKLLDRAVRDTLASTRRRILFVALGALLAGLAGALLLTRMMTGPIRRIAQGARIIGQGKLDHRIAVTGNDELGELAADFNRMSDQLKELDRMKSDFVSSVTHELRSPLLSLRMYIDLFFKGTAGEINDKQREYLQVMRDCSGRLARFIDDLLDAAKIERGKMQVTLQPVEFPLLAGEIARLFAPQADQKNIRLRVTVPDAFPRLLADPERTRQVLTNLLSNAVKFTPEGGAVTISAAVAGSMAEIAVADTGIGVPADKLERIFDKFEQVKDARQKISGPKGTGLGLAIVKGIIEAQGGRIRVTSELNKGSIFTFSVPLAKD